MRLIWNVRAWLFGCRSRDTDDQGVTMFCTLRRGHGGEHEAHTCGCAGWWVGCVDGPVDTWPSAA